MLLTPDDIHRLSADIWRSVLGLDVVPAPGLALDPGERSLTGCVHISGDWEGSVTLECPSALATRATSIMFEVAEEEVGAAEVDDALGEITNMTGGSVKSLVPGTCALSLPAVVEGMEYSVTIPGAVLVHEVVLSCDGAPIVVRVLERAGAGDGAAVLQSGATLPIG